MKSSLIATAVLSTMAILLSAQPTPAPGASPAKPGDTVPGAGDLNTYAVQARIEAGDRLGFISGQRYEVITRGASNRVDLVLKRIRGAAPQ